MVMDNRNAKVTDPAKLALLAFFPITGLLGIHDYLAGKRNALIAHIVLVAISLIIILGGSIQNIGVDSRYNGLTIFVAMIIMAPIVLANLIFAVVEGGILLVQNAQLKRPKDGHSAMLADIIYALVTGGGFLLAIMVAQVSWFGEQVNIFGVRIYSDIFFGIIFLLAGIMLGIIGAAVAQKPYAISLWVCLFGGVLGFFLLVL